MLAQFTDADQIQNYAREAMAWAVTVGLFEGNADGALNPRGNATRAEVATLIMRFAEMTAAEEAPEDAIGGADEATDITVTDGEETTETETPAEGEETTETETPLRVRLPTRLPTRPLPLRPKRSDSVRSCTQFLKEEGRVPFLFFYFSKKFFQI